METKEIDVALHQESGQLLLAYLKGDKNLDALRVKAAMSGYNGSTRAMSTLRVKEAMQYGIIKDLAANKNQLRDYIKATMPNFIPAKLLE